MTLESKSRSNAWYLVPILFAIIGGLIAYFALKNDDPKKAKNCLIVGVIITVVSIAGQVIMGMLVVLSGT